MHENRNNIIVVESYVINLFSARFAASPIWWALSRTYNGEKSFRNVEIDLPVSEMDMQKEVHDKKLCVIFQNETFPYIRASASNVEPDRIRREMKEGEKGSSTLYLGIKIRDIEQMIKARVIRLRESTERVSLDMVFPVSLKDYGLKPTLPFFGLIRVDDKMIVKVAVGLEARPV